VLLAGGAARRFGGAPKGLATIDGRRIADQVLMALSEATDSQVVACNDPRATDWFPGHRIVADREPGLGPLAGLVTALRAAEGLPVIVVAWDMPFVTGTLLRSLHQRGELAAACAVPVHGDGTAEPLCAYYRPEALPVAEALLARGERRARALYETLAEAGGAVVLSDRVLQRFGGPDRLFMSVDTPEMLAALGGLPPTLPDPA
jgi:molybdenum cofactor guanylyltransferase